MESKSVLFKEWECVPIYGVYANGRAAIQLVEVNHYTPVANCSVNIPEVHLEEDEVLIKSWSENEGMEEVLIEANIIGPSLGNVATGFVSATKHKILDKTWKTSK